MISKTFIKSCFSLVSILAFVLTLATSASAVPFFWYGGGGGGGGSGDMQASVYDPAGGARQVAFSDEVIGTGTAAGQMVFWETGGPSWAHTETSEMYWDDTGKEFYANLMTIGFGAAGVDYTITFDGEDNDGIITWLEDEDAFDMACDLQVSESLTLGDGTAVDRTITFDMDTSDITITAYDSTGILDVSGGMSVGAQVVITDTANPHIKGEYDASNYFTMGADSNGYLDIVSSGDRIQMTTANHLFEMYELSSTYFRLKADNSFQFYVDGVSDNCQFTNNNDATRYAIRTDGRIGMVNNAGIGWDTSNMWIWRQGGVFKIQSHASEPIGINTLGNDVGIGTDTPDAKLDVLGTVRVTNTDNVDYAELSVDADGDLSVVPSGYHTDIDGIIYTDDQWDGMGVNTDDTSLAVNGATVYCGIDVLQTTAIVGINLSKQSDLSPPMAAFTRARDNAGVAEIIQDDDVLGEIQFAGYDGTDFAQGAIILAEVSGTPGSDDMPSAIVFKTSDDASQTPTERVRITPTATEITAGELEIPNGANPSTTVEGSIAYDTDEDALEVYDGTNSRLMPSLIQKGATVIDPDGLSVDPFMIYVDPTMYPGGIKLTKVAFQIPADAAYTLTFEEWTGDPPAFSTTIEAVTTTATDNYAEVTGASIDDSDIAAGNYVVLDFPATAVDQIHAMVYFWVKEYN